MNQICKVHKLKKFVEQNSNVQIFFKKLYNVNRNFPLVDHIYGAWKYYHRNIFSTNSIRRNNNLEIFPDLSCLDITNCFNNCPQTPYIELYKNFNYYVNIGHQAKDMLCKYTNNINSKISFENTTQEGDNEDEDEDEDEKNIKMNQNIKMVNNLIKINEKIDFQQISYYKLLNKMQRN